MPDINKQTEKPSKRLFQLVEFMCADNSLHQIQLSYWPKKIKYSYLTLNEQVSKFDIKEMDDFASAECEVVDGLINDKNAQYLHDFLCEIFDGDLHYKFISSPDYIQGVLRAQLPQAKLARDIKIDCLCNKAVSITQMFRCLYCGIYFCNPCASEHFQNNYQEVNSNESK